MERIHHLSALRPRVEREQRCARGLHHGGGHGDTRGDRQCLSPPPATENAEVGESVTSGRVESIHINGRNFIQLATLVPGAVGPSLVSSFNTPVGVTANAGINFNGERQSHNVFSVDGQENYDRGCGGCIEIVPDQDAIQEFKVLSSNASQDLGFGSAAHIQLEIKSGGQAFHGEVFEFNRNRALETQPYFTNLAHQKRPYENYNDFGFNLGGPFGKPGKVNKTFFFTTIDWRRLLQATTMLGNAQSYSEEQHQFLPAYINNHTGLWFGDDWKAKPALTLNLGLRWEGMPHANCGCGGYRANLIGNPNSGSNIHNRLEWFNTAAFAADPAGQFGDAARNIMRGQSIDNFDVSVFKNFAGIPLPKSREGGTLQLRFEFYNFFNHTQFTGHSTGFGSSNFGQATSARLPRQIQLGAKLAF